MNDQERPSTHQDPEFQTTSSHYYREPIYPYQHARQHEHQDRGQDDHKSSSVTYPVEFHGKTSEYFKIWIVNLFLTIITLYIYSAWAKVRTKRYFYGNTLIDGSSFEYHARGRQLVIGRMSIAALVILYFLFRSINVTLSITVLGIFAALLPWVIWRSLHFNARASSFRNIYFNFKGTASTPYVILVLVPLLTLFLVILSIATYTAITQYDLVSNIDGLENLPPRELENIVNTIVVSCVAIILLLLPLLHKNLISYSHRCHRFGSSSFSEKIKTRKLYRIYSDTFAQSVVALFFMAAIYPALYQIISMVSSNPAQSDPTANPAPHTDVPLAIFLAITSISTSAMVLAYFRSKIRNHRYNATTIGNTVQLRSHTDSWSLWVLNTTNLLLLIFTLGIAYPHTRIRSARYFAKCTSVIVDRGLDSFMENQKSKTGSMGEEIEDALDVQFDLSL